jgi:hypothetical protein
MSVLKVGPPPAPIPMPWLRTGWVTSLNPPRVDPQRPVVNRVRYEYWLRKLKGQ